MFSFQCYARLVLSRYCRLLDADTELDAQMHEAVSAIAATGVSPVVRIAANEGWMVKRKRFIFLRGVIQDFSFPKLTSTVWFTRSSGLRCPRYHRPAALHTRRCQEARGVCQIPSHGEARLWKPLCHGFDREYFTDRVSAAGE